MGTAALIFSLLSYLVTASNAVLPQSKLEDFLGGILFTESITEAQLQQRWSEAKAGRTKVKIMIVPGHDDEAFGTAFRGLKEAGLTAQTGEYLAEILAKDPAFAVTLVRSRNGYESGFADYFLKEKENIRNFQLTYKSVLEAAVKAGKLSLENQIDHGYASSETVTKLYGLNKWANEMKMDIVIHLHFNDYPGRKQSSPGKYSGYSIYVPNFQFSNAKASRRLAEALDDELKNFRSSSTLPKERGTIIDDYELIAVGANNTLDSAVALIEYGYIYESLFIDPSIRDAYLKELAFQTYRGLKNFFGEAEVTEKTTLLPHFWTKDLRSGSRGRDVLALQAALKSEGIFPPPKTKDCFITGVFGSCTAKAVKEFQKKYGILPVSGEVGPQTRLELNTLYAPAN